MPSFGPIHPGDDAPREHMRAVRYVKVRPALRKVTACGASESARAALRFLVLTACSTVEVRGAKWGEIDLFAREWRIPADRMKSGREHRVLLSDAAVAVLESARHLRRANDLVFPSPCAGGSGMLARVMTLNNAMKSAGLGEYGTPHGFRSSFRDWCSERTDADRAVCEKALAHAVGSAVERSYARSDLFEKRCALMDAWAEFVA